MASGCSSCGAPIVWCFTVHDRKIPIDRDPVPNGNMVIEETGLGRDPIATHYLAELHKDRARYVSHFATCPHALDHRKGKA